MTVEKAVLREGTETFERYRLLRQDASAVLLYDPERRKVILTRQFRYPVAAAASEEILEIVAGKVDSGELPSAAAIREVEEETGYRITDSQLTFHTSCFSSPGYSTEQFHLFSAIVSESDKTAKGGGLEEEHEKIELVELDFDVFQQQIKDGTIRDGKTIIAGLLFGADL